MDFEVVVEQYSKLIYQTAYLYVRNLEAAEDITQDVLLTYYKKQHQFRGDATLKTYLTRMTLNRCHDYESSWKNKAKVWIEKLSLQSSEKVDEVVEERMQQSELITAIHQLKPHYREVIILYYFQELLVREIADVLSCTENTVHTRLKRAREQLKGYLVEEVAIYEKQASK